MSRKDIYSVKHFLEDDPQIPVTLSHPHLKCNIRIQMYSSVKLNSYKLTALVHQIALLKSLCTEDTLILYSTFSISRGHAVVWL